MSRVVLVGAVVGLAALAASSTARAQVGRIAVARAAVDANKTDAVVSLQFGGVLRKAGKYEEAVAEFRRGALLPSALRG